MAIYQEREDDLESELNKGALWAVTYGDLMSYLMIFFLTVLAFTVSNIQDYDQLVKQMKKQFGDLSEEEIRIELSKKEDTLAEQLAALLGKDQVAVNEEKVKMTFANPVLFDFGSADLKPAAASVLKPLADTFMKVTNDIIVEGHTDNRPIYKLRFKNNFELSAARAYAVMHYLEQQGIPKERLIGMAYGESRPTASNESIEGRAQNRRIEITLVREKKMIGMKRSNGNDKGSNNSHTDTNNKETKAEVQTSGQVQTAATAVNRSGTEAKAGE